MWTVLRTAPVLALAIVPVAAAQPSGQTPGQTPGQTSGQTPSQTPGQTSGQTCTGSTLTGSVRDTASGLIPGAAITLDGKYTKVTGAAGRFRFPCLAPGRHRVTASFDHFVTGTLPVVLPRAGDLVFKLIPSDEASITVNADDSRQIPPTGGSLTLSGTQLQALADDPDDLLRQLQQLSAGSGGSPGLATISVDGFQDTATLPPKDSIAYINVAPDLFSAEYREPPFDGSRIEVYTKPGAKTYHGALFTTNSSSWLNARDPFTSATGTVGKQRYGFDLNGPVRREGSNFSLNLEHRSIDETVGVSAIVPDANGNPVLSLDTVPVPQRLWIGNARVDVQLGPKNVAFISYAANVNSLQNLGVGGQTLRTAGYSSGSNDQTIRASDITLISAKLVHEARASYDFSTNDQLAASAAPSLQVAGYFTGGGATIGNELDRVKRVEYDDDFILTTGAHSIKTGIQLLYLNRDSQVPTNFNGAYIFSGSAGAAGASVSALTQYQQAVTTGGTATEFNNVSGNPEVKVSQVRFAGFFEDSVKLSEKWMAFYGLRYFFETDPFTFNGVAPRGGFSYTPDKKKTLVLKAHFGVFNNQYSSDEVQELHREDGVQRITSLVYNPVYGTPLAGATPIQAKRTAAPGLNLSTFVFGDFSASKDLPLGFNVNYDLIFARELTITRTVNINSPTGSTTPADPVLDPYGPRPLAPNLNILELRNDGTGQGYGLFAGLSNQKLKHVQFSLGALHLNLRDNTDDMTFNQPQSAYTDAGETERRDGQNLWQTFGMINFVLPYKLALSANGYANGGQPFNLLTGQDNNGDGNFNDRPQYAPAGSTANGTTIFQTRAGLLTNAGAIVNGVPVAPIPRNLGALPWSFHLDANLQRAFKLTQDAKATHQQTVTVNVRSANFINHTNVTAEGSVLGTPQFLVPISADTARRIEFGARYSF